MLLNMQSDAALRALRPARAPQGGSAEQAKGGRGEYRIPRGGAFRLVSCPNYLGEILEWAGFALATGGAVHASAFAVFTACILGSRAVCPERPPSHTRAARSRRRRRRRAS
jgi:3-oxo-5-alpha-steroid 4-dehydrogenase 1